MTQINTDRRNEEDLRGLSTNDTDYTDRRNGEDLRGLTTEQTKANHNK
jgi:hypothetical protein